MSASHGTTPNDSNGLKASQSSLAGLSWLNFLTALMLTGFGTFLVVYLTNHQWSRTDIGFALSAGTVAGMAFQVPGGMLVDWLPSKRFAAAGGVFAIMAASVLIAVAPWPGPVFAAQALQGLGASVLTPAIAALTLALARRDMLGERFGRNVRFAAIGSALAAAITGLVGAWLSLQIMFLLAAFCAVPCLVAIFRIREADLEVAPLRSGHAAVTDPHHHVVPPKRVMQVARDPALLVFAGCLALFQFGNAGLLPTAAGGLARGLSQLTELRLPGIWPFPSVVSLDRAALLVGAWIVVPQLLAALLSHWLGRYAQLHGRRQVLLIGFGMLPLRALLFATTTSPVAVVAYQMLDGISAAVLGIMTPLVVADITQRGGRFNLAIGIVGLVSGIGGALSTAVAGTLADQVGDIGTFIALGAAGLSACLLLAVAMQETHIHSRRRPANGQHPAGATGHGPPSGR